MEPFPNNTQQSTTTNNTTPTKQHWLQHWQGRSFNEISKALLESVLAGAGAGLLFGVLGALAIGAIAEGLFSYKIGEKVFFYSWLFSGCWFAIHTLINYFKPKKPKLPPEMEYALQKMEEIRSALVDTGKAGDVTKLTLVISASSIKHDNERLWSRSGIAFTLGCFFLIAALSGPIAAIWLVTKHQDWRYFLASMSSSAVMLAAAAVLFRHENRLRSQYRLSMDEIAYFDRLRIAIDCSRAISEETHKETLKQVISYLVTPGPVLAAAAKASAPDEKELLDNPLEIAGKIVDASAKIAESALDTARKSVSNKP